MIAYEDLVVALTNWRANQGMATSAVTFLAQETGSVDLELPVASPVEIANSGSEAVDEAALVEEYADEAIEEFAVAAEEVAEEELAVMEEQPLEEDYVGEAAAPEAAAPEAAAPEAASTEAEYTVEGAEPYAEEPAPMETAGLDYDDDAAPEHTQEVALEAVEEMVGDAEVVEEEEVMATETENYAHQEEVPMDLEVVGEESVEQHGLQTDEVAVMPRDLAAGEPQDELLPIEDEDNL